MIKSVKEERYRWIKPILNKELKIVDVTKVCPHSESSLKRWLRSYREGGIEALEPGSTEPKTQKKETCIEIKERVIKLRKKTRLCSLELKWKLEKQRVSIHEITIDKILKREGLTRKYRVKKVKYKYIKAKRHPGELLEIDVKHVPGPIKDRKYYQYTAIDTASRWRHLEVFDEECIYHSMEFLKVVLRKFPYTVRAIKTDSHSTFTNYYLGTNKRSDMTIKKIHTLDMFCAKNNITHYLIDPGSPAQNGTVERSHREDQEKFYERNKFGSFNDLKRKIRIWNDQYNNLEHCGLSGKTPN